MLYEAIIIMTAKSSIKKRSLVRIKFPIENISLGIAGTINALVVKTAIMDGIPKTMAVLMLTNPFLKYPTLPTALVKPTMNNE
jgi:hypothetical protein